MRKFLSIIIPRYKETEKELFPLLSSISTQVGIDFSDIELIITNDGGGNGELDSNFLKLFDIDICQINLEENKGPGVVRQVGLNHAKGEYVMFCDADDILHNAGVLGALIQEAESNAPDMIYTSWLEELLESGRYLYITHENENTWMHGKLIRRQFLVQNNIRFHDELRVHEDSYFLSIAASLTDRKRYLPITSYIWKFHSNSITRQDGAVYTYNSIPEFIKACTLAHSVIERFLPLEVMQQRIVQFTLYNYFCFHQPHWQAPENEEFLKNAEDAFIKYIKPLWQYWESAPQEMIYNIYNEERAKSFANCVESETIWMWIERIGLKNS